MAWHLIRSGEDGAEQGSALKEFLLDSADDILNEPTEFGSIAIGSTAHTTGNEHSWEKGASGWEEIATRGGGGGGGGNVDDVQINGTSIVDENKVANIPVAVVASDATASNLGLVKVRNGYDGLKVGTANDPGRLTLSPTSAAQIKAGNDPYLAVTTARQHEAAFFGMAKAAGDSTQSASSNAVGTYTEAAKSAISSMLNAPETVSGTTPTIVAKAGIQYVCGEVSTIDITPCATGICDVVFRSGSTPAVLTMPNTVIFPSWFDPNNLEADTYYEINVLNGTMGTVALWA